MTTKTYRKLEDYIISLFNSDGVKITWNGITFDDVSACKPTLQSGWGECKTDVYVALKRKGDSQEAEIKISVKGDGSEFLANKLTDKVALDLLGENWSNILVASIQTIEAVFRAKQTVYLKGRGDNIDAFFTLGWKLEVADKPRTLSSKLNLSKEKIIRVIFKGEDQPVSKKNARVFNQIVVNSGVAEYLLKGNEAKYNNAQAVVNDLISFDDYDCGDIYLIFTANNYRLKANKADGARTLAVAIDWSVVNGRLSPKFIFDKPLVYQGETHKMPLITKCLNDLGVSSFSDLDIGKIKPN